MGIDWIELSKIAPSIIVVLVYAYFTERMRRDHQKAIADLIVMWQTAIKETMEQERVSRKESTMRLAEEIKGLAILIGQNSTLLSEHDKRLSTGIDSMREVVRVLHGTGTLRTKE